MVYGYYSFIPSLAGGVFSTLAVIPIPVITNARLLRPKTQWQWENIWLIFAIFALFIIPLLTCLLYSFPIYWTTSLLFKDFSIYDWIVPVCLVTFYSFFGLSFYALSVEMVGIGISTSITFGISAIVYTLMTIWSYNKIFQIHIAVGVLACVALFVILVGLVIVTIGSHILEKETRIKRFEAYDMYKQTKTRQRVRKNKDVDAQKEKEKEKEKDKAAQKKASKGVVKLHWYAGFGLSCLAGISSCLLQVGMNLSDPLVAKILVNVPQMNAFGAKMLIVNLGLILGAIFVALFCAIMLIARRTIRKYVVVSGGFAALGGCLTFNGYRFGSIFISAGMAFVWYASIVLLVCGEAFGPTLTSFHHITYAIGAIIPAVLVSIPLKEYTNTKHKKPFVIILLSIGYPIIILGLVMLAFGTAIY